MRGNAHVRFGRRAGETDHQQWWHRAPVRPDHTHAALLIATGGHPKLVQERLGHHSAAFTLDVYGHLQPGLQRDAAERVADLLDEEAVADPVADEPEAEEK